MQDGLSQSHETRPDCYGNRIEGLPKCVACPVEVRCLGDTKERLDKGLPLRRHWSDDFKPNLPEGVQVVAEDVPF